MQKDVVRLIWDIRGLVDKAINNHNMELYEKARKKFLEIKEKGMHFKSVAFDTLQVEYETEEARDISVESSYIMILCNLNSLRLHKIIM